MKLGVKAISRLRSTLAFGLMLWCAGAGCMVVTYAHSAMMSAPDMSGTQTIKHNLGEASDGAGGHSCCKVHHAFSKVGGEAGQSSSRLESFAGFLEVSLPEAPGPSGASSCCPLTSGSFVTTSRAASTDDNASTKVQTGLISPTLTNSLTALRAFPVRLPDQNQTYLHDCVFLI